MDPVRFTQPLESNDGGLPVHSDGYRLVELVNKYWIMPDGSPLKLDEWQRRLIIRALERTGPKALGGQLRFRQVLMSIGRQNGKSVLGAIFGLYGLIQHSHGATVLGLATSVAQANIIYDRAAHTVRGNRALSRRVKATGTRGIKHIDGSGSYIVKPAKTEALQGIPITVGLIDELHILPEVLWDDVVNGQRAQTDAILVGITTAGDEHSALLKRLYDTAEKVTPTTDGRFGAFIYEGTEDAPLDDRHSIKSANPAVACGRIDIESAIADIGNMPEASVRRYLHNRFVASLNPWIDLTSWRKCAGVVDIKPTVIAVDQASNHRWASFAAGAKVDGQVYTELIASIEKPNLDQLERVCKALRASLGNVLFVMDGRTLGPLAKRLIESGYQVRKLTETDATQSAALAYALIKQGKITHAGDELLGHQVPRGIAKSKGEAWRISKKDTSVDIDALIATVEAIYAADSEKAREPQLFV